MLLFIILSLNTPVFFIDKTMIRYYSSKVVRSLAKAPLYSFSEGTEFLGMVEKYFDKAGKHTSIRADMLNFYKRADNVVKFNLTLVRGNNPFIKMMTQFKLFLHIVVSIKLTNCQPKVEPVMPRMLISLKLRLSLA